MGKQTLKELDEYIEFMERVYDRFTSGDLDIDYVCPVAYSEFINMEEEKGNIICASKDAKLLDKKYPLFHKWIFSVGRKLARQLPDNYPSKKRILETWENKNRLRTFASWRIDRNLDVRKEKIKILKQYIKHLKQRRSRESRCKSK